MTFIEIILLAVSLCFDTVAVSMGGSVTLGKVKFGKVLKVALVFDLMQTGLLFMGWLLGNSVVAYIEKISGIVGFLLLLYIGGSMIIGSVRKGREESVNLSGMKSLILAAVATSIDAAAVGVSLAMAAISRNELYLTLGSVLLTTMLAAFFGIYGGSFIGRKFGKPAQIVGGLVLIAIGIHILVG